MGDETAIELWREKIAELEGAAAIVSDVAAAFEIKKRLKEARSSLDDLLKPGSSSLVPEPANPALSAPMIIGTSQPPSVEPKVDLSKLPAGASDFLGRDTELTLLDKAWADQGRTQMVELVAAGGVGKTALIKRWLDRLKIDGWRGARRVYGWSFFSQGSSSDRQASDDSFLSDALHWLEVEHDAALSPWDKGKLLAQAVSARRTLLVLDGIEPLQYPPGPQGGRLRAPGLQALLRQLAGGGQLGLCVLSTRESIEDLHEYERNEEHPTGALVRHNLSNLSEVDGARGCCTKWACAARARHRSRTRMPSSSKRAGRCTDML